MARHPDLNLVGEIDMKATAHSAFTSEQMALHTIGLQRSSSQSSEEQIIAHQPFALGAPGNFGQVIPGSIYRSQFPNSTNFEFLASLKLKTVLTLVPGPYPEEYEEFLRTQGVHHTTVELPANKDVICINPLDMKRALDIVMDTRNHPLLIHCNKGKHRTGCVVGSFRRIQGVAIQHVLVEYRSFAGKKARQLDEKFIGEFDLNIMEENTRKHGYDILKDILVDGITDEVNRPLESSPHISRLRS